MVLITVGPVIGQVTNDTIRVLLELDANANVACVVRETGKDDIVTTVAGLKFVANKPHAFTIRNLTSSTQYTINFRTEITKDEEAKKLDNANDRVAITHTMPIHTQNLAAKNSTTTTTTATNDNVLSSEQGSTPTTQQPASTQNPDTFISTAKPSFWSTRFAVANMNAKDQIANNKDLWHVVTERVLENKMKRLDFVLHVGSQVNQDAAFKQALGLIGDGDVAQETEEKVAELFRATYRKEWNHPPLRKILSSCCNVMTMGEGELGTALGTFNDTASKEHKAAKIARKVYWEYQRALWDEHLDTAKIAHDFHTTLYDTTALVQLDQFGGTFANDGYLGKAQWTGSDKMCNFIFFAEIQAAFSDSGKLAKVQSLVLLTHSPIALVDSNTSVNKQVQRPSWAFGAQADEQKTFLNLLSQWVQANPNREILVATGSLGLGCHCNISTQGKAIVRQVISGPITCTVPATSQEISTALNGKAITLPGNHSCTSSEFCTDINFGILNITVQVGKKPLIENWIIRPSSQQPTPMENSWINKPWSSTNVDDGAGCCTLQ